MAKAKSIDHRIGNQNARKHGMWRTPEWGVWQCMLRRCYDARTPYYHRYGGRGILVCRRWRTSFPAFYRDMGKRPSPRHEIDRIDNDGHYSPGNCRWATRQEQARNRRSNRLITHAGETLCLAEWAARAGLSPEAFAYRLNAGWPFADAVRRGKYDSPRRTHQRN